MIRAVLLLIVWVGQVLSQAEFIPTPTVTPIGNHRVPDKEESLVNQEDNSLIMVPGDPDWVPTEFEMPEEETLSGCAYPPGYSFPSVCIEGDDNKIVFHMDHDSQEVLDEIVRKQGKQGKYNKIPPGYLENLKKELGEVSIIDPGVPYTIKPS